jgi:hypothetical protein
MSRPADSHDAQDGQRCDHEACRCVREIADRGAVGGDSVFCSEVLRKGAHPQNRKDHQLDGAEDWAEDTDELVRLSRSTGTAAT